MSTETRTAVAATALALVVMTGAAWWWLPQKWQACKKLHDNRPAQIFCFISK
jgi:hypothetical protein